MLTGHGSRLKQQGIGQNVAVGEWAPASDVMSDEAYLHSTYVFAVPSNELCIGSG